MYMLYVLYFIQITCILNPCYVMSILVIQPLLHIHLHYNSHTHTSTTNLTHTFLPQPSHLHYNSHTHTFTTTLTHTSLPQPSHTHTHPHHNSHIFTITLTHTITKIPIHNHHKLTYTLPPQPSHTHTLTTLPLTAYSWVARYLVGTGYIWGVNANDDIFKCKKPCNGAWAHIGGKLKQIHGGYGYVYRVNSNNDIFTKRIDGSGGCRYIPGLASPLLEEMKCSALQCWTDLPL